MNPNFPATLQKVAELSGNHFESFRHFLQIYLHHAANLTTEDFNHSISPEPTNLPPLHLAFLAATAETLALRKGTQCPSWAMKKITVLDTPYFEFSGTDNAARGYLLRYSPSPFKRRNLFVTDAVLDIA